MGIDAGVASSSDHSFIGCHRDVLVVVIHVLLGQSVVDQVHLMVVTETAHHEVFWFDVAMDIKLLMNIFQGLDQAHSEQHNGLFGEFGVFLFFPQLLEVTTAVVGHHD